MKGFPVSGRVDVRDLAVIIRYFEEGGFHHHTRSKILSAVVHQYAELILANTDALPIFNYNEALERVQIFTSASTSNSYSEPWRIAPIQTLSGPRPIDQVSEEELQQQIWDALGTPPDKRVLPPSSSPDLDES